MAYSLSLSPTSPGRTKAAAWSVMAGCPEGDSASSSIFLLLCLPDAVRIELELSAWRQLISTGGQRDAVSARRSLSSSAASNPSPMFEQVL